MASINARDGSLFFDFRYRNQRCREYTKLPDTPANRKIMAKALARLEAEMAMESFDYEAHFPGSKLATKFAKGVASPAATAAQQTQPQGGVEFSPLTATAPLFNTFAATWLGECTVGWRRSHLATVHSTLDVHLIPTFGEKRVSEISKADVLQFRSALAKRKGRSGNATLSAKTINRIVQILGQMLAEAADRYDFINPVDRVKRLKQQKVDIQPFSMEEVRLLIATIRTDFRNYLTVRFFSGMRTGELHGLKWKYVDFERRQILVRETVVRGEMDYTKTEGSQREISMSQPVFEALQSQLLVTGRVPGREDVVGEALVFSNSEGVPLDTDNVTNRVWYPLLRHLGLTKRRPYQTRHTFATLLLGAGENPEFVARQLGHANTMMLFRTYSRFVPNLTRKDGSAFDRFVSGALYPPVANCTGSDVEVRHAA